MGDTEPVTTLVVHGAGSTGQAAAVLVAAAPEAWLLEDRSGDIEILIARIEEYVTSHRDCTTLVGVSLGAHAVARWASGTALPVPRLVCVLPAWTDAPALTASATAASAREIAERGIPDALRTLFEHGTHDDIVELLRLSWADYESGELAECLLRASASRGPTRDELSAITAHVCVIGWLDDDLHPASVAHEWVRHLRHGTIAMAMRPQINLIRQALRTVTGGV